MINLNTPKSIAIYQLGAGVAFWLCNDTFNATLSLAGAAIIYSVCKLVEFLSKRV